MFKIGNYTLSWRNPGQYLVLWMLTTLLLLVLAGFVPGLAITFAIGVLFVTLVGLMPKHR